MAKLIIIANQPIRLDRDVAGDEVLATIETDHNVSTLLMMLQQRQARLVSEEDSKAADIPKAKKSEPDQSESTDNSGDNSGDQVKTFEQILDEAGFNAKTIKLLAGANVTGFEKAKLYLAEHKGSFEPIKGIGDATNAKLIELITKHDS